MKKIGVLRAGALGDLVLSLPALKSLKESFPESQVILLGREFHRQLLEGRPSPVDRIIPLPSYLQFDDSLAGPNQERERLIEELKREEFDLLLQLHGGGRFSNAFLRSIGGKKLVGASIPEAPSLDVNVSYTQFQHEVLRQLEIVAKAGARPTTIVPQLTLKDRELLEGHAWLEDLLGTWRKGRGPVLLNPGASDPRRRWPMENFARLYEHFSQIGRPVLVNLGPREEELRDELRKLIKDEASFISPSISRLGGVLVHCELVVSNDTGTMHLAQALGVPTVGLFWCGNLLNYGPLSGDTNRALVSWRMNCPTCGRGPREKDCGHKQSFIAEITFEEVVAAAQELLTRRA